MSTDKGHCSTDIKPDISHIPQQKSSAAVVQQPKLALVKQVYWEIEVPDADVNFTNHYIYSPPFEVILPSSGKSMWKLSFNFEGM